MKTKILKLKDVLAIASRSRSFVYALAQKGEFPKPIKLAERSSAWVEAEVSEWIESLISLSDREVA